MEVAGNAHVFHRSICQIYRFLKFCVLYVQVLYDQSHVSKDIGVNDSPERDSSHAKEDFPVSDRSDIIASQQQDGVIDADHVFVEDIRAKQIIVGIDAIKRRHPELLNRHNQEPNTCLTMNEHDEEEDELRKLHHQFYVLFHIHLLNDTAKPRHSDQLQQAEEWQDLVPLLGDEKGDVVEGDCRQDVYGESSFEILHGDCLLIKDFLTRERIIICSLELEGNINAKYDVNQGVDD